MAAERGRAECTERGSQEAPQEEEQQQRRSTEEADRLTPHQLQVGTG